MNEKICSAAVGEAGAPRHNWGLIKTSLKTSWYNTAAMIDGFQGSYYFPDNFFNFFIAPIFWFNFLIVVEFPRREIDF